MKKCAWKWYGGSQNPSADAVSPDAGKVDSDVPEVEKRRATMTEDAVARAQTLEPPLI